MVICCIFGKCLWIQSFTHTHRWPFSDLFYRNECGIILKPILVYCTVSRPLRAGWRNGWMTRKCEMFRCRMLCDRNMGKHICENVSPGHSEEGENGLILQRWRSCHYFAFQEGEEKVRKSRGRKSWNCAVVGPGCILAYWWEDSRHWTDDFYPQPPN